jgi:Leucine-rich repeat (LRR) protein
VLTEEEIAGVNKINVYRESIQSLKGIEYFTALTYLNCSFNPLTSLDVSKNTALTYLNCNGNQLTLLDVSKNTALTELYCTGNQLTSLDVSKNTALTSLNCYLNLLTSIDVSKNTALTYLSCSYNQLTSLDLSKNTALTRLDCYSNQLTSLDVSKNTALTQLYCYSNQLTSLDLSGCTALTQLYCYQNRIKDDCMDALVTSLPIVSSRTMRVMYYENEQNVMIPTQVAAAKAKGWIPLYLDRSYRWHEYAGSDPSGIQCIMLDKKVNAPIYDLNGRRLTEPQKGINIIGGKKVLIH